MTCSRARRLTCGRSSGPPRRTASSAIMALRFCQVTASRKSGSPASSWITLLVAAVAVSSADRTSASVAAPSRWASATAARAGADSRVMSSAGKPAARRTASRQTIQPWSPSGTRCSPARSRATSVAASAARSRTNECPLSMVCRTNSSVVCRRHSRIRPGPASASARPASATMGTGSGASSRYAYRRSQRRSARSGGRKMSSSSGLSRTAPGSPPSSAIRANSCGSGASARSPRVLGTCGGRAAPR